MEELLEQIETLHDMNERLRQVLQAVAARDFEQRAVRQELAWRRQHPAGLLPWSIAAPLEAAGSSD